MADAGEGLGKMVGPLPLGGWVAVIGAGLVLAMYSRSHLSGGAGPSSGAAAAGLPTLVVNPAVPDTGGAPVAPVSAQIITNTDWYRQALVTLEAHGSDPVLVDRALRNYLMGNQLTPSEAAIQTLALQLVGPPPEMPAGTPLPPTPITPPPPAPAPQTPIGSLWTAAMRIIPRGVPATIVDVQQNPKGPGGWALDSWGGIHEENGAPKAHGGPYWVGGRTGHAVRMVIDPSGRSGVVIDNLGVPHPFSIG